METELLFTKQTFYYGSHHFWVMSYGNRELSYQKTQSKQALKVFMGRKFSSVLSYFFLFQNSEELFYWFSNFILWPKKGKTEL